MSQRHTVAGTDLGPITIVAEGDAVTGLYFRHHIRRPARETFGPEVAAAADPLLDEAARQLLDHLAGRRHEFDLPLAARGDEFQQAVWNVVATIPRGETITYGEIAAALGEPQARLGRRAGRGREPVVRLRPVSPRRRGRRLADRLRRRAEAQAGPAGARGTRAGRRRAPVLTGDPHSR